MPQFKDRRFSVTSVKKPLLYAALFIIAATSGVLTYRHLQSDFNTIYGESYRLDELEEKWVVLNYFAEWCAPCLREIPELNEFNEQKNEQTLLFGVNYDLMSETAIKAMAQKHAIGFDVIINNEDTKLPVQTPQYLPATFIINPRGEVVASLMGEQKAETLLKALDQLQSQAL